MSNNYGEWLRAQREEAGLTQQELANAAVMTRSHIAHIEAGRRIPSREDARRLDNALNTGNVLSSFLPQEDVAVADYFEAARQLEQQATMIREFALSYVPGILQTETYARAVLRVGFPPKHLGPFRGGVILGKLGVLSGRRRLVLARTSLFQSKT